MAKKKDDDFSIKALQIVEQATQGRIGEPPKNLNVVELERLSGKARFNKLTSEQRREVVI